MTSQKSKLVAFIIVLLQFSAFPIYPQNSPVLFWLDGEPHFTDEFLYAFNKNREATALQSAKDIDDYFELYLRFRLKVKDAKAHGFHERAAFIAEMNGYKKQLAKPYLSQNVINEQLVSEAYERTLEEIEASHILLSLSAAATTDDTLKAYNRLLEIKQQVADGATFADLAKQFSQDPSASQNGGYLGFFGAFQMVYPFEDAAFKTPTGQVSAPFSTSYGYHIVFVHSRRRAEGSVKLAHIFFRHDKSDTALAYAKAVQVSKFLAQGEAWETLTLNHSEETTNKAQGGELPWLPFRQLPPSFYAAAQQLNEAGQVTGPIKTESGWHIIKLIEKKAVPPLEEVRAMIESRISRDGRATAKSAKTIESLLTKLNISANNAALEAASLAIDGRVLEGTWSYDGTTQSAKMVLASGADRVLLAEDFYRYVELNQKKRADVGVSKYSEILWKQFFVDWLEQIELEQLYKANNDYRFLYNEYYDGTLLFDIMNEKVWQAAGKDTTGLKNFFAARQKDYVWDERAIVTIFEGNAIAIDRLLSGSIDSLYMLDAMELDDQSSARRVIQEKSASFESVGIETDSLTVLVLSGQPAVELATVDENASNIHFVPSNIEASKIRLEWLTGSKSVVEKHFNAFDPLSLKASSGTLEKRENVIPEIYWKTGRHLKKGETKSRIYDISQILPSGPKALSEIRGKAVSDYQEFLESEWIGELKNKYPLKVNNQEWKKTTKVINEK